MDALCWREAEQSDDIAAAIHLLRAQASLSEQQAPLASAKNSIQTSSRLLRELSDLLLIHRSRSPLVSDYLVLLLPCIAQTLRDIQYYIGDGQKTFKQRWVTLEDHIHAENAQLRLIRKSQKDDAATSVRFDVYVEFLIQLARLMSSRPEGYNKTVVDESVGRLLIFRALRGLPAPRIPPFILPPRPSLEEPHWGELIFENTNPTTKLGHQRLSTCFGTPVVDPVPLIPTGSKVLFKLTFDSNHLSLTLYIPPVLPTPRIVAPPPAPRILCRWRDAHRLPAVSSFGVHELCILRRGSSLALERWSVRKHKPKAWVAAFFRTYEKMVLFHAAFIALKARSPLTVACNPDDFELAGERKLFLEKTIDDGFDHALTLFEDKGCKALRLAANVDEGELKRVVVWVAFLQAPQFRHLRRHTAHRVWISNLRLHVFDDEYHEWSQRQKRGEFEIYFVDEKAADRFMTVMKKCAKRFDAE